MSIAMTNAGHAGSRLFEMAALPPEQLSTLLGLVYQGPMETTPWSSALEYIRRRLDASFVSLVLRTPASTRPGLIVNASVYGASLPGEPSYTNNYYALCPFVGLPTDEVRTADEIFGESGWHTHKFYKQYLKPLDLRYILAANIRTDDGVECAFFVSRPHGSHDYSAAEKAFITVLLPHFRRAVDLHSKLDVVESERSLYAGTIARMLIGTVILDEAGMVLKCNSAVDELITEKDGIGFNHGLLEAYCPIENRKFQKAIRVCLANRAVAVPSSVEVTTLSRPSGKPPLSVLIRPIPLNYYAEQNKRRPAVAVFIRDPACTSQASRETVRKLFKLTRTETELALLMADGLTLDEAAEQLGIMKNTVRAHLRGIFAKTGATRQATLMKTLLNSVVSLG
ncbi:helix-turn-helix transcriptional regulator [Herbaspirillum sp. GCM10030257]|uniref:helix-turn-helix transcriptional regulator n=1 Tax=Herbaspirillum sp. GCM10030257 TaxID=3273393 RepID=UPI00361E8620